MRYYQRPDVDHVRLDPTRTSLSGYGGTLEVGKQGGGHWMYIAGVNWRSPGLELNDMGFLAGSDEIMQYAWVGYRVWKPAASSGSIRSTSTSGWDGTSAAVTSSRGATSTLHGQFRNYWYAGLGMNRNAPNLSMSGLRGGPALALPGVWSLWANVETDVRKKARFELQGRIHAPRQRRPRQITSSRPE